MNFPVLLAFALYTAILLFIGIISKRKNQTSNDFIIGGRSMNFWLTALAAHASDMSSWIFMGYPAMILVSGLFSIWAAIGLTVFMFLNWQFVAPRLRTMTEKYNSLTLCSFFESRFADTTGTIRIFTVIVSLVFYTVYISAGLVGLGILMNTLTGISYIAGVIVGSIIIIPYLFISGYVTLAWTDFFQGLFLMVMITIVPLFAASLFDWSGGMMSLIPTGDHLQSFIPKWSVESILNTLFLMCGWGLGYFGQPHIITKFMGINDVKNIKKSKWVGISWQIISLTSATFVGIVGLIFFKQNLVDPQLIFIKMTTFTFTPFFAALTLCAIVGATITCVDSQILVLVSNFTEDLYKRTFKKTASSRELLIVSRINVIVIALIACIIACFVKRVLMINTISMLVSYAWFGLGSSFGPLVLFSLYYKKIHRIGAWCGLISGALVAGVWPIFNKLVSIEIPALIPGFIISSFTIWIVSYITQLKSCEKLAGDNK